MEAREDLSAALDGMNYCETAGDCVLLNGCPYGCNNLIHKDAEWDELAAATEKLTTECPACTDTCSGAFRSGEIACVEGKCVGNR